MGYEVRCPKCYRLIGVIFTGKAQHYCRYCKQEHVTVAPRSPETRRKVREMTEGVLAMMEFTRDVTGLLLALTEPEREEAEAVRV